MTNFKTQTSHDVYRLQFETDSREKFLAMQDCARDCIDNALDKGWISVNDRLPETETYVLVHYVGVNTGIDFYQVLIYFANDDEPHFQHMLGNKNLKVTHWMPLPKPPKEEDHAKQPSTKP